jgi:hypothetical protein
MKNYPHMRVRDTDKCSYYARYYLDGDRLSMVVDGTAIRSVDVLDAQDQAAIISAKLNRRTALNMVWSYRVFGVQPIVPAHEQRTLNSMYRLIDAINKLLWQTEGA